MPSLYDHGCSLGRPGGFLQRMREGTWMGHVLEHVALELQNLAGAEVSRGKTRGTGERGVYNVVFEHAQEDVGLAAGKLAVRLLNHLIYDSEPDFDFQTELEENVIRVAERLAYGPSTGVHRLRGRAPQYSGAAARSAALAGAAWPRRPPEAGLGDGHLARRRTSRSTSPANKELTNRLLQEVGIPVPRSQVVRNADDAVRAADRIGYPVVIKPLDGNHGRGVCINLTNDDEVREFYPVAEGESRAGNVMVESYITGKDYRILVVNGQIVAVAERVPAHVVGDGKHTVQELIEITNSIRAAASATKRS